MAIVHYKILFIISHFKNTNKIKTQINKYTYGNCAVFVLQSNGCKIIFIIVVYLTIKKSYYEFA